MVSEFNRKEAKRSLPSPLSFPPLPIHAEQCFWPTSQGTLNADQSRTNAGEEERRRRKLRRRCRSLPLPIKTELKLTASAAAAAVAAVSPKLGRRQRRTRAVP